MCLQFHMPDLYGWVPARWIESMWIGPARSCTVLWYRMCKVRDIGLLLIMPIRILSVQRFTSMQSVFQRWADVDQVQLSEWYSDDSVWLSLWRWDPYYCRMRWWQYYGWGWVQWRLLGLSWLLMWVPAYNKKESVFNTIAVLTGMCFLKGCERQ